MDAGLLAGLAEGIKSGVSSYREARSEALRRKQMEQAQKLQAMTHGMEVDEEGNLVPTEYSQRMKEQQTQELDPESPVSQRAYGFLKAAMPEKRQGLLPEKMSAKEVKEILPLAQSLSKQDIMINSPWQQERLELQKQKQATTIGSKIEQDKIISSGQQSLGAAERGKSILMKTDSPVTAQDARVAAADLARIIQGGNPAQGTQHEVEFTSAYGRVQKILQEFSGQPTDALPEPMKKQLILAFDDLSKVQKKINAERAQGLAKTYRAGAGKNPYVEQTLQEIESRYQMPKEDPTLAGAVDPAVDTYARQHGLDYNSALMLLRARGYGK